MRSWLVAEVKFRLSGQMRRNIMSNQLKTGMRAGELLIIDIKKLIAVQVAVASTPGNPLCSESPCHSLELRFDILPYLLHHSFLSEPLQ